MNELYTRLYHQIEELREAGFEPDKVVVHGDNWDEIKEKSEVVEDPDVFGGEKTMLNGVRASWNTPMPDARIMFETDMGDSE